MFEPERRPTLRSSTQLGIYRDLDDLDLEKRSRLRCRLRCCAITAFAALSAFLVSITLVQLAGANSVVQLAETKENRTSVFEEKKKINFNVTQSTTSRDAIPENISETSTSSADMIDHSKRSGSSDGVTLLAHSAAGFESKINISYSPSSTEDILSIDALINHNINYLKQNESVSLDHTNRRQKSLFADRRSSHGDFPYRFENLELDSGGAYASDVLDRVMTSQPRPFIQRPRVRTKTRHGIRHNAHSNVASSTSVREHRLRPYSPSHQYPNNANNIQDIIHYLNSDTQAESSYRLPPPISPNSFFGHTPYRKAVKFAGVYLHPQEDDDQEVGSATYDKNVAASVNSSPSSLNGHAYVSDPFLAYKPEDPSEVNLLASSSMDGLSRHQVYSQDDDERPVSEDHDEGHNKYKYFPRPPISFEKPPSETTPPPISTSTELYTSAIYRPLGHENKSPMQKPRTKPFSIMLDIYPMTEPSGPASFSERPVAPTKKPQGYHPPRYNRMKPMRNRVRPAMEYADSKHHQMVVHLNLYPKKKQRASARNDDTFGLNERESAEADQEFDSEVNYFCNKSVNVALALENSGDQIKGLRVFQDGEEILPDYQPNESDYESEEDVDSGNFHTHTHDPHSHDSGYRQSLPNNNEFYGTVNEGSDVPEKESSYSVVRKKPKTSLTRTRQIAPGKHATTRTTKKSHSSGDIISNSWNNKYSILPRSVVPSNHKDRFVEATYAYQEKPELNKYFSTGGESSDQDKQFFTSTGDAVASDYLFDRFDYNTTHPEHETQYL